MRSFILFPFALIAVAFAVRPAQKPVVISFPDDTPSSIIDKAIAEIKKDGGIITHEYSLIKGFAAKVTEATLDKISALTEGFAPVVEDDFVVKIDGSTQ